MHTSLIPAYASALAQPLAAPPCPIFDAHMHVGEMARNRAYVRAARAYGVSRALGMLHEVEPEDLYDAFGDFFVPCVWATRDAPGGASWAREEIERLEDWRGRGAGCVKYKVTPVHGKPACFLDDERLQPVLRRAAELGYVVMAHIAEPSLWWPERFDPAEVGSKESYFPQVEAVLREHPAMRFVGAHMGGSPEDLGRLAALMETYPNYYVDTSATKWIVRELSRQREAARAFFLRFADRILFGSDLVAQFGDSDDYFTSRFHVQRFMWEADAPAPSMIADPDAVPPDFPNGPELRPLGLPAAVLQKIYWQNAAALFADARAPQSA